MRFVFDRKNQASETKKGLVQAEIKLALNRCFISTGVRVFEGQWDSKKEKVCNNENMHTLNQSLNDFSAKCYEYVHQCRKTGEPLSIEELRTFLEGTDTVVQSISFLKFMDEKIKERRVRLSTIQTHLVIFRALKKFGKIKAFRDLTRQNIIKWDAYAHSRCKSDSSCYNYHKILKIYINEAIAEGHLEHNPYNTLRFSRGQEADRRYLTKSELKRIEDTVINDACLNRVRDLFVFACYTGMSYGDISAFDFSNVVENNGVFQLSARRVKTNTQYKITLLRKPMQILEKYNYKLPIISNQKYNLYLKAVSALCDIKANLTSHVARHTFATTVTLANGVRIEVISKMLGHTNIVTTQRYAKIFQEEVDNEFARLNMMM